MNARKPPEEPTYELLCRFVDTTESFVLGFEAGRLAQRMQQGDSPIADPVPVHTKNIEQLRLLASTYGYDAEVEDLAGPHEGWSNLRLSKKPPQKPARHLRAL